MAINFQCDKCSKQIVTAGKNVGSTIKCPGCQGDVLVPNPNKLPSQIIQVQASKPMPSAQVESKGQPKRNAVDFTSSPPPLNETPEIQIREPDPLPVGFSEGGKGRTLSNSVDVSVKKEILIPQKSRKNKNLILFAIVLVLGIGGIVTCVGGVFGVFVIKNLVFTNNKSEIGFVKNGTLPGYRSVTLDNGFKYALESPAWSSFQTEKGVVVVECRGFIKKQMVIDLWEEGVLLTRVKAPDPAPPIVIDAQFFMHANGNGFDVGPVRFKFESESDNMLLAYGLTINGTGIKITNIFYAIILK